MGHCIALSIVPSWDDRRLAKKALLQSILPDKARIILGAFTAEPDERHPAHV